MARGIEDILTDRKVLDWGDRLQKLETKAAVMLIVTNKLGKEKADNQKFVTMEDRPWDRWFYVGTITSSGPITGLKIEVVENDTSYAAAAAYITVGDLLYDSDKDHTMRVTAIDTGTGEITVTALYAGQGEGGGDGRVYDSSDTTSDSHTDPADGDRVLKMSNAFPNGGTSSDARAIALTEIYNFIQKFKHSFDVNEEMMWSELHGEDELVRLQGREVIEFVKDIEYQFLFGERDARLLSNDMIYTTAGIFHHGITEDSIASADFTESAWRGYLKNVFTGVKGGATEKMGFYGGTIIEAIDKFAQGRLVLNDKLSVVVGMEVLKYKTTFGTINIIFHPLLENDFAGWGVTCDMNYLKVKVFGPDMTLNTAIQANDSDTRKDQYKARFGLKLGMKEAHRIIKIT